jgi:hypothetical protein
LIEENRAPVLVPQETVDRDIRFTFEYMGRHEIILRVVGPRDPTLKKP